MREYPKISVVIPNYNHGLYLEERFKSILCQTYDDYEIIVLDDCSTDDSLTVIDKYRSNDHVTQVIINEKNSGNTFLQWDKGIHLAKGDLIWIAESDDYCEPNMLEKLVAAFYRYKDTSFAYTTSVFVDEAGKHTREVKLTSDRFLYGNAYITKYLLLGNTVLNASSVLFSREKALDVPIDYLGIKGAGDYLFWVEMANRGRVAVVNKGLNYFRRHSGVVSTKMENSGANCRNVYRIFEYASSLAHVRTWRIRLSKIYHELEIAKMKYDSEEIRQELYALWQVPESKKFDRIILRIFRHFRITRNIYL